MRIPTGFTAKLRELSLSGLGFEGLLFVPDPFVAGRDVHRRREELD